MTRYRFKKTKHNDPPIHRNTVNDIEELVLNPSSMESLTRVQPDEVQKYFVTSDRPHRQQILSSYPTMEGVVRET